MADHATVIHNFISPIVDLPSSLVKPSDWNHGHTFQGGVDGDLLTKDASQTDGVLFKSVLSHIRGRLVTAVALSDSVAGSGSPTADICLLNFTLQQSNSIVIVIANTYTNDNSVAYHVNSVSLVLDNSGFLSYNITANTHQSSIVSFFNNLSSGSHSLKGHASSSNPPLNFGLTYILLEFTS